MKDILQGVVFLGLFLVPFLPVYVENDFFFPFITGKNFAFRIIIEIIFAAWVLLALYDEQYRPKFSWILGSFAAFLGVMALANALGVYPLQSFWSNFERMDGYITLVHLFMFITVAGSVLTSMKLWGFFFHTTLVVALLVALHGLGQYFGVIDGPASSRVRIDSRLGNAAYMAVYMLFHVFIALWLFVRSRVTLHRLIYLSIAAVLAAALLYTGTRGTFIGLVVGIGVTVGYVALFGRAYPELRKASTIACVVVALLAGVFFIAKDTDFVQGNLALSRIANIDLGRDLVVRGTIWSMAWEGVKERPLLGWGQSNFNYVFNEQYDPSLYSAEAWFDRTHNIVLDWLIAGGFLGLIAYASIIVAALYYLFWQPLFKKEDAEFNVLERGVLLGLLAGYVLHNLVVFDNIISYIFFACILALIHAHVGTNIKAVSEFKIEPQMVGQFVAPIVIIVAGASVYFLNAPGISAAGDIIDAMTANSVTGRLQEFHSALERGSFAQQEIVEQLAQSAMNIARNQNISESERQGIAQRAELELLKLAEEKPGDARVHAFLASFYRSIGAFPQAKEQAEIAHTLSPEKQAIITEQGLIEMQLGNNEAAKDFFKRAFELDERNTDARIFYGALLAALGQEEEMRSIITDEYFTEFADNDFALAMADQGRNMELLIEMLQSRIESKPEVAQNRASLAYAYYQTEEIQKAIEVLEGAAEDIPAFAPTAQCFIGNLKVGKTPDEGC